MNRLIAQKRRYMIENTTKQETMQDLIDKIYDYEESKICKNCNYLQPDFNNTCAAGISIPDNFDDESDITFGCNMWESK